MPGGRRRWHRRAMRMRALLLAAAALAGGAAPARADVQLTDAPGAEGVESVPGVVMWSRDDPSKSGRTLVAKVGDAPPADLPVPPLGVDDSRLGVTSGGRVLAFYSRCRDGRRCDIWQYDFATGTERRVRRTSQPRTSETHPSYDRGALAFARDGRRPGLYLLRPGARRPVRIAKDVPRATAVDQRRRLVALATIRYEGGRVDVLETVDFAGRSRRVVVVGGEYADSYDYVGKPTFAAGWLYWARASSQESGPRFWRARGQTAQCTTATVFDSWHRGRGYSADADLSTDGSTVYYTAADGIWRADPTPSFMTPRTPSVCS